MLYVILKMFKWKRYCSIILIISLLISLLFSFSPVVLAHRMLIRPIEEGVIKVEYEGGRFSRRTEVVVYNKNNVEIARGPLDQNGHFYYSHEAAFIVAEDGLGHRAEWRVGENMGHSLHRGLTIFIVILCFTVIAAIFQYRIKKQNHKE